MKIGHYSLPLARIIVCILLANSCIEETVQNNNSPELISLNAFLEPSNTKTTLINGGTSVYWEQGDEISVLFGSQREKFISSSSEPSTSTEFWGSLDLSIPVSSENPIWGLYPYDKDAKILNNQILTFVPPSQEARVGTFAKNANLSLAKSSDFSLRFFNVCGGLRFSLTKGGIKRIVFEALNGESIAGRFTIGFQNDEPVVIKANSGLNRIQLIPADGGYFKLGEWYYLVAIPGDLQHGFKITFYRDNSIGQIVSKEPRIIKRGVFGSIPNIDSQVSFSSYLPEAIDMGLPSGTKWGSFNLGALYPEEIGDYYAWGETETKGIYDSDTYKWLDETSKKYLTKYCCNPEKGLNGFCDMRNVLEREDDIAYQTLGSKWRIPFSSEWEELINNSTITKTTKDGVLGYLVTSNITQNTLFFPCGGMLLKYYLTGTEGNDKGAIYRAGDLRNETSSGIWFHTKEEGARQEVVSRYYGIPIRPVFNDVIQVESIQLLESDVSLFEGFSYLLRATISPDNAICKGITYVSSDPNIISVDYRGIVTALHEGEATITATTVDGSFSDFCHFLVKKNDSTMEAIDLGLPSGIKWGSCNLGAQTPEQNGYYFSWSETYIKQCYSKLEYNDSLSNVTVLEPEYDVCRKLGGEWRMPIMEEFEELMDKNNCTWQRTLKNGIEGVVITSNFNSNSIFLPFSGMKTNEQIKREGIEGYYWSSSHYYRGWAVGLSIHHHGIVELLSSMMGYLGYVIRPVYGKHPEIQRIILNHTDTTVYVQDLVELVAKRIPHNSVSTLKWSSSNRDVFCSYSKLESEYVNVMGIFPGEADIVVTSENGTVEEKCHIRFIQAPNT